jgi:hypothetical protein
MSHRERGDGVEIGTMLMLRFPCTYAMILEKSLKEMLGVKANLSAITQQSLA